MSGRSPSDKAWMQKHWEEQEAIRRQLFPEPQHILEDYRVVFDLFPSPCFGVPDPAHQLVPDPTSVREDGTIIPIVDWEFRIGPFQATLNANNLALRVPAYDPEEAHLAAERTIILFFRYLTFKTGLVYSYTFRGSQSAHQAELPGGVHHFSSIGYSPETLHAAILECGKLSATTNPDLDQALVYHSHAMVLLKMANEVNQGFPKSFHEVERDYQSWLSDIVLNLWKAQAQILGEGRKREDSMVRLGLSPELTSGLNAIADLRNKGGVAHTRPKDPRSKDLRASLDLGRRATEGLILIFRSHLDPEGAEQVR